MASPWFEALSAQYPGLQADQVERFARGGIEEFVQYLQRARLHQENTAVRAAWQRDDEAEGSRTPNGIWVELCAPAGETDRFERDLKKFFAEQSREVFEASADEGPDFSESRKITILDADENSGRLLLGREPGEDHLLLRPNTYAIHRQTQAMRQLKHQPRPENLPLLRLLGPAVPKDGIWPGGRPVPPVEWPEPQPQDVAQWFVLTREIEGIEEQRLFVRQALASPDFSILEGPPGSGKTTVICELVMQLVEQGKRVLLCASTHVAVDNVLERLKDKSQVHRDHVLAVRIGDPRRVSVKAQPFRLDKFEQTVRQQITDHLQRVRNPTAAQQLMAQALRGEEDTVERLVLECANLVCGTTIGILQHPDIKAQQTDRQGVEPVFDVLVVDEASKTTFQEFLVPALLAKRWVLVGDPQQLSPYVEDDEVAANVQAALPDERARCACLDIFDNRHASKSDPDRWKPVVVVSDEPAVHETYARQAEARGVDWADGDTDDWEALHGAPVILATSAGVSRAGEWPVDMMVLRGEFDGADGLRRRALGYPSGEHRDRMLDPEHSWEGEIAWRLLREYEQRLFEKDGVQSRTAERYREDRELLLPAEQTGIPGDQVRQHIQDVQRIALPSVLESLQMGFGRRGRVTPTTLSEGLPSDVLRQRHTRLTYQRRMHPEISRFPRDNIYHRQALLDPSDMAMQRKWPASGWDRYASRAAWLDVPTATSGVSEVEAAVVIEELQEFLGWASRNPRSDGRLWQVAVLTFYRRQEGLLKRAVRSLSGEKHPMEESILRLNGRDVASAHVCTVDRFQGHEADIVFLSVANQRPTSFLESPNRINVAITRARYQLVVIGHRHAMAKCRSPVLSGLAKSLEYGLRYTGPKGGRR